MAGYSFDERSDPRHRKLNDLGALAFEQEFEGIRRDPQAGEDLFNPSRYYEIFSGSD